MTLVLFCADPFDRRRPDPDYACEAEAVAALGAGYGLIDYEALVNERDAERSIRRVPRDKGGVLGVYRGWMLTPEAYGRLYAALDERGITLVNDPAAYQHCHHLPEWYPVLAEHTPPTVWLSQTAGADLDMDAVMARLRPFGGCPLLLKDYVKSRKHEWLDACFIPTASDRGAVERVTRRFLELQGDDLAGGLVFRRFEPFERIGAHPVSGLPLTHEHRLFFADGQPLFSTPYWDEADYPADPPPLDRFAALAQHVASRFFAMDVAKRADGEWRIVELGDGQVSGLPDHADVAAFYRALLSRLAG